MGFNIGVSSEHAEENIACDCFIDRAFYNFVNSAEMYGNKSILIQSGNYYGLDLSPLLKLVYTWDEVTQEYIKENIQHTEFLLDLVSSFQNKIKLDRSVCNKINYVWYDSLVMMTDEEMQQLIKEMGKEAAAPFLESIEKQKKEIEANPDPWNWYFENGQIIEDLGNLIKSIQCFKDKGITEIYLTAG